MANLLSNTTIGGYQSIHTGNIGSYAITSLSGYATQSWVQSQGYITGSYLPTSGGALTGQLYINNTDPTIYFQDTDNRSAMIHVNSNVFYVLRGTGTNSTGWATYNGYWPLELNLENNNAVFGGIVSAPAGSFRAPIFYDSADTTYYFDGNSTTSLRTRGSWRADSADWDGEYSGKIQYHSNHWYFQSGNMWFFRNAGGSNVFQVDQSGNATFSGAVNANVLSSSEVSTRYFTQSTNGVPSNNLGSPTVTEMALFDEQFNNKTAFYDHTALSFWTSSDGVNFTEYTGFSTTDKKRFLGGDGDSGVVIPNLTNRFRIELENTQGYVFLNQLYIYWSSNSHSTRVKIWVRRCDNNQWYQWTDSDQYVSSWPGHLYLPFGGIPFYPGALASTGHYNRIRIEFIPSWSTGTYSSTPINLMRMQIWGGYPAGKRNVYYTDENRNVTFPAEVGSTAFYATDFRAANAYYLNGTSYFLNSTNGGIYTNARFETAGNLVVGGNSYLGNGNGDEVHINDILRVGATDSGDAHFYFGEGGSAGSDYGSHWYWDSGYTFTWNTRNNGTDTALFSYVTNDTSYVNWSRHFNMQNREVNYVSQLHFNGGTRFVNYNSNYLYFQPDSASVGGILVRDGNSSIRGYSAYFDGSGFGLLNSAGSWGIRLNPGNGDTLLYSGGNWKLTTISAGISVNGNVYTNQNFGDGLVGVYSSTRYQGVFAMGDAYKLATDGTTTGSLYGLAWSHPNAGGVAGNLNTHGLLVMENGGFLAAISGSIRSRDDMRAPIFYDSQDTSYYADFNSSVNNAIRVRGGMLMGPNPTWGAYLQIGGDGNNSSYATMSVTNGNIHIDPKNGYSLYLNHYYGSKIYFGSGGAAGGSYHHSNFSGGGNLNLGGGDSDASYRLQVSGTGYASSDFRAPIFYDSNNTDYYGDFASTSVMNAIRFGTSANNGTLGGAGDWGMRLTTDAGYIQFGPANGSYAHIYTDRATFYFNKDLLVNGSTVITAATIGSQSVSYASTSGALSSMNISQFTNNSGYITSSSLSSYLPLAGGTMTGKIFAPSFGSDAYGGAFEIRERGFVSNGQSDWSYSPAISFHWGNRHVQRFGVRADGLFAIDDAPIALRSWVSSQGFLTSINSTQVTNALGYTPYNSSNPSGYITSSGSISGNAATATLASTVTINYNNDSNSSYQLLWGSGNSVYGTANIYVNPNSDTIYASAYRGNANVAGTGEATYHPAGVYSTGTNWLYGTMYLNGNTINEVSQIVLNGTNNYPINITGASHKYLTINPGNGYEAMVRYVGGSGSSWYVGKRTSGQLVGTQSFHFYSEEAGATVGGITPSGDMHASGSMRAPIFYDSQNTDYYGDFASESRFNTFTTAGSVVIGGTFANNAYNAVASTRLMFGGGNEPNSYSIGTNMENYGGNYTKLDLRWHTGIRMGAQPGYGGIRFYNTEALGTRIMSIGEGDANIRIDNNLWIGGAGGWITDLLNAKQNASTAINTGNIGSQSVSYASSAGSVAWTNVSSRPTALSQFSNDLGNYGGWITSSGSISGNAATATNVAWTGVTGRPTALSQFSNDLGNYGGWLTTSGKAADSELIDGIDSSRIVYGNGARGKSIGMTGGNANTLDSANASGFYYGNSVTGMPTGDWWNWLSVTGNDWATSDGYGYQMAGSFWTDDFRIRRLTSGSWASWVSIIHSGNIGSQSVNYASSAGSAGSATSASQLNKYGDIYGQDWNGYYLEGKFIAAAVYGMSGANKPPTSYDYGVALSYGESTGPRLQWYFPENQNNIGTIFRKGTYRTGWNGNWSNWKTLVEQEGNLCTIVGGNGTGLEVHGNVGYNQDPLTYFLIRGQADTSWKALKVRLTGDAGGQDIEFRRIAENGADSRMWYVPRGGNTVNFDYPIVQPSDSRLKDNITPISTPVEKIKALSGVEFDWNSGEQVGTHDVGLIAQDVEAVLPEAVTTQEDGYKNLAYTKVIPLLVEAMKEQQTMIEALKAEIELLKNR